MAALNALVVRLLAPGAVIGAALWAGEAGVGLFNLLPLPGWLVVVASVLLLDLTLYGQHVAFHRIALLWRLHRMHHAHPEIAVTTGARFPPPQFLLSVAPQAPGAILSGAPAGPR